MFSWFEWVWFDSPTIDQKEQLGIFCGDVHDIDQGLWFYVLNEKGEVLVRSTVIPLSTDDNQNKDIGD